MANLNNDYARGILSVAAATAISLALQNILPLGNLSLVFLTAVLWVAARTGIRPALFTAFISFLTYNFVFTEPRLTLHMTDSDELLTVVFFLITAMIVGNLAARLRQQIEKLRASNNRTTALLEFTRRLASAPDIETVQAEAVSTLSTHLTLPVLIVAKDPESDTLRVLAESGSAEKPAPEDYHAAEQTLKTGKASGAFTSIHSDRPWRFEPIESDGGIYAALGIEVRTLSAENYRELFIDAYTHQLGLAWLRTELAARLSAARIAEETERLRSALLSSISHDLRTPLASMIGSASTLQSMLERLSPEDRKSLLDSIVSEGQRLDRYIRNLLDMTKLGHGSLKIERDWIALTDLLSSALRRTRGLLEGFQVDRRIDDDLPLLFVHPALIEQALVNVLENATKFAPEHSTILIAARATESEVMISISDQGPGIPESQRGKVFDMFFTGGQGDRGPHGSGLGLAICQGMVAAHGGSLRALSGPGNQGATIEISLPLPQTPMPHNSRNQVNDEL